MNFANFVSACDQIGVFNHAAAITTSSVLHNNVGCSKINPL